jgi:hypothetical protein
LRIFKKFDEVCSQFSRFIGIAGIESRLSAAGLRLRVDDIAIELFENICSSNTNLRKKLIHKTGNE